jgi:hypothetical protein
MGETFSKLSHSKNPPNKLKSSRQPPATPADNELDDSTIENRELVIGSKASTCDVNSHPVANEEVSPAHQPTPQSLKDVEMSSKTPKRKPLPPVRDLQQDHRLTAASQQVRKGPYHVAYDQQRQVAHPTEIEPDSVRENTRHARQNSNASGETSQPPVGLWSWIPHISQSADDPTVVVRVKEVLVMAEQFVSNFYYDRAHSDMRPNRHLDDINHSPLLLSVDDLATELAQADHQLPLIKHSLITQLLSLISFDTDAPEKSLLPKEFRNFTVLAEARGKSTETDNEILREAFYLLVTVLLTREQIYSQHSAPIECYQHIFVQMFKKIATIAPRGRSSLTMSLLPLAQLSNTGPDRENHLISDLQR